MWHPKIISRKPLIRVLCRHSQSEKSQTSTVNLLFSPTTGPVRYQEVYFRCLPKKCLGERMERMDTKLLSSNASCSSSPLYYTPLGGGVHLLPLSPTPRRGRNASPGVSKQNNCLLPPAELARLSRDSHKSYALI